MRQPDLEVSNYLKRWWILPRNRWFNVYLHRFEDSDLPVLHDHPWVNCSIILCGQYREHLHDGTSRLRSPGNVVFRGSMTLHWLEVTRGPVWTLFLTGRRKRDWGFRSGGTWLQNEEFTRTNRR